MRRTESSAFRAPRRLAGPCALISAGVLAATLLVASPAVATDYPSWDDVVAAQNSESAKATQIAEIEGLIPNRDNAKEKVGALFGNVIDAAKGAARGA